MIDVGQWDGVRDGYAALVLLADGDCGGSLVEPDPKALEFLLDDGLVAERLEDVEDDEDEVTCARD